MIAPLIDVPSSLSFSKSTALPVLEALPELGGWFSGHAPAAAAAANATAIDAAVATSRASAADMTSYADPAESAGTDMRKWRTAGRQLDDTAQRSQNTKRSVLTDELVVYTEGSAGPDRNQAG